MKKTLIFIVLQFFCLQNEVFATIQKTPEKIVHLQKLSFKQKVFTYLIQRKMRHLNAKQTALFAQKGKDLQDCVTIKLKNGSTILATIVSMDDKSITYQLCEQANSGVGTVRIEQVTHVMDAQNRMIFNNQPKNLKTGVPTSGDKNAKIALSVLLSALALAVLTLFSIFLFLTHSEGEVPIVNVLGIISLIGIVGSFIMGIISLGQMAKTPPQKANSKFLAILATVLSGLCIASLLLVLVL